MSQLVSTPEQQRLAAESVATRTLLDAEELLRLSYLADADESLMEEALRPSCTTGNCDISAAEQTLCLRLMADC
ncbi:MAG: hypothetical protein ACYC4L_19440 [Chloroflexota bacterium]